jgi:hypothetical protein
MSQEINQLVEAMNAHDLDAVVQLFHNDYHSEQPAHPARSRTFVPSWFARLMTVAPVGPSGTGGATAPTASPLTCGVSRSSSWSIV